MKSKWKVTSNVINGEKMYAVYRLIDENKLDHSGNREYHGEYRYSKELDFVINPIAYALYQVWKKADRRKRVRK